MHVVRMQETVRSSIDLPYGKTYFRNFIGQAGVLADGPQAYLIEMPEEGATVPPHFHDVDQFQLAMEGDGLFGKKPWAPGGFVYADAYAPYGPIRAGQQGVGFLTLRVASSSGQYDMPASRGLIPKLGKQLAGAVDCSLPVGPSTSASQVIASRRDGLKAASLRLAPGAEAFSPATDGGGQYLVVCAGSVLIQEQELPPCSLVFLAAGEPSISVRGGPQGGVIAVLQFPQPSDRPGSDPAELSKRAKREYYIARKDGQ